MMSHKELGYRLKSLQEKPDNRRCCDCFSKDPSWASLFRSPVNENSDDCNENGNDCIGAFICYTCSSAHKKLGSSVCEVKSVSVGSCKFETKL
eukprot:scaffold6189_cov101-Cylindrotheca_fusiformis.AAC.1